MGFFDFDNDSRDDKNESQNDYAHLSTGFGGYSTHFGSQPASVDTCDTCKEEREANNN